MFKECRAESGKGNMPGSSLRTNRNPELLRNKHVWCGMAMDTPSHRSRVNASGLSGPYEQGSQAGARRGSGPGRTRLSGNQTGPRQSALEPGTGPGAAVIVLAAVSLVPGDAFFFAGVGIILFIASYMEANLDI